MQLKIMLDLADKNLGATGGTAYSNPFLLKGLLDVASLAIFLHAKKEAGSTPTLDVSFEYSWDGTHWYATGLAFTQVTTSTDSDESKMWGANKIGPRIRAKYVIGGTVTPTYDIWVAISAFATGYWG
jgi:hypothetical protein